MWWKISFSYYREKVYVANDYPDIKICILTAEAKSFSLDQLPEIVRRVNLEYGPIQITLIPS